MRIERISIKGLTIGILLLFGGLSILLSLTAADYFRDAALDSQVKSLSRGMEVASGEIRRHLVDKAVDLGTNLRGNAELRHHFLGVRRGGEAEPLLALLDDPFITGFVGAGEVELVKLRLYDADLNFVAASRRGYEGLPERLPDHLRRTAAGRSGADRLKVLDSLWLSPRGALHSTLVPVGGLRLSGYLEVVLAPLFNYSQMSRMTRMPIDIFDVDGELLHQHQGMNDERQRLPVEFWLLGDEGERLLRLVGMEDVEQLYSDMHETQFNTTLAFLGLLLMALLISLMLFSRFLFLPVRKMMDDIERCTHGDLAATVDDRGLKEFHRLAGAFNSLNKRVKESIQELQRLSALDGLTGIANRRLFDQRLEQEWQRAMRNGSEITLLLIDIDFFKKYNDSYGHQAGDNCLRTVAMAVGALLKRSADLAARYGGEEFAVLLPETSRHGGERVAEKIQAEIARLCLKHRASNVSDQVTLSIGVATIRPHRQSAPFELIAAADKALYRAKDEGRNRIEASNDAAA